MSNSDIPLVERLANRDLLRSAAFVGGHWAGAEIRGNLRGHRPGDRRRRSPALPKMGAADTRHAIEAAAAGAPRLAGDVRRGPLADPAPLGRHDQGQRRRHRHDPHRRAGQAGRRGQGRGGLQRRLPRLVRRGGPPRLRRHHPLAHPGRAHPGAQAAGRGDRGHHPVEPAGRDDHPQGRARAGGGQHDGAQAGRADPADGAGPRPTSPSRPGCPPGCSTSSPPTARTPRRSARS